MGGIKRSELLQPHPVELQAVNALRDVVRRVGGGDKDVRGAARGRDL